VTVAEAALLAGLVKSPSRLAPTRNFDAAQARARIVLAAMEDMDVITKTTEKFALAHPPVITAQSGSGSGNYVADWVMDVVDELIGHIDGDLVVVTTIDTTLQAAAEKALTEELAKRGEKSHVGQGALLAMTPGGAVRAMVGGLEQDHSYNVTKGRAMLQAYAQVRALSDQEREALPLLARGAALRFLLTRLVDWLAVPEGALVKPKDPLEYVRKLRFHQSLRSVRDYGLD
jgi:membrane carboxypeptidase/penicillin-binding protein